MGSEAIAAVQVCVPRLNHMESPPHVGAAPAQGADAAVVVLTGTSEGESDDREALGLPADQAAFLAALMQQVGRLTSLPHQQGVVLAGASV